MPSGSIFQSNGRPTIYIAVSLLYCKLTNSIASRTPNPIQPGQGIVWGYETEKKKHINPSARGRCATLFILIKRKWNLINYDHFYFFYQENCHTNNKLSTNLCYILHTTQLLFRSDTNLDDNFLSLNLTLMFSAWS